MGALLIEGDHRQHLREIFQMFKYRPTGNDALVAGARALERALEPDWMVNRILVRKPTCFLSGWTVIVDHEFMDHDAEPCCTVSAKFGARVLGWVAEGASDSYGFNYYAGGQLVRGYLASDDEVTHDVGKPLPFEERLRRENRYPGQRNQMSEKEVLELMREVTGVDYDRLLEVQDVVVVELDESSFLPGGSGAPPAPVPPPSISEKKSRWRF